MNFKGFGNDPPANGGGGWPPGNDQLVRQSSIYSLTFDEFQSTVGGSAGKDFGSMNMDELLKNIWSAEEIQSLTSVGGGGGGAGGPSIAGAQIGVGVPATPLQKQGSLTLPRTLSQKTVDEVWRDLYSKEGNSAAGSNVAPTAQRQQTLGEITLEEFLVRAGVVREDNNNNNNSAQFVHNKQQNGAGFFGANNNINNNLGIMNPNPNPNRNPIPIQAANLPLNVNGVRSSNHGQQQQLIFPKQQAYGGPQMSSPHAAGVGGGGVMGMAGLRAMAALSGSPANQMSSDGVKSNGDTSSVSPVPFVFNSGLRGRKGGGTVEKVVERRQRRMIKNRESAARSRARKQAYTMELEAEVAKLKEDNDDLKRKQDEMVEIHKNQQMEMMKMQRDGKKRCLRRTQTGPW